MWHFHGILALGLPIKCMINKSGSGKSTGKPEEKTGEMSWHSWCWRPYFLLWALQSVKGQTANQRWEPCLSNFLRNSVSVGLFSKDRGGRVQCYSICSSFFTAWHLFLKVAKEATPPIRHHPVPAVSFIPALFPCQGERGRSQRHIHLPTQLTVFYKW